MGLDNAGCAGREALAYSQAMPPRAFADADPDDPGDEALMLAYAAGDAAAFDALYARRKGGVYRYLVRHCGNAGAADELFQDVWMNVIRARATYAPNAKFATWLYRIAHNRLVDHWRTHARAEFVATDVDGDEPDPLAFVAGARGDEPEVRAGAREQGSASTSRCRGCRRRSGRRSCCTRRAGSNSPTSRRSPAPASRR